MTFCGKETLAGNLTEQAVATYSARRCSVGTARTSGKDILSRIWKRPAGTWSRERDRSLSKMPNDSSTTAGFFMCPATQSRPAIDCLMLPAHQPPLQHAAVSIRKADLRSPLDFSTDDDFTSIKRMQHVRTTFIASFKCSGRAFVISDEQVMC